MGKHAKTGEKLVAGGLLWATLALSSCLLPQYDEPLPAFPPAKNRPPRLVFSTANPQLAVVNNIGTMCSPPKVEIAVDDEDLDDRIRIRWVVYGENGVATGIQPMDTFLNGSPTVRRPTITAPMTSLFKVSLLGTTGAGRRLQLIIADGEFSSDPNTGALITIPKGEPHVLPDGGFVLNETYIDTYSWIVDTVNMSCTQ